MNALEERFQLWVREVEQMLGHRVDHHHAWEAYVCYEYPMAMLTPTEYAQEFRK